MNSEVSQLLTGEIQEPDILFFTCATRHYKNFIVPYVWFAHTFNPRAKFEFIIDQQDEYELEMRAELDFLRIEHGISLILRDASDVTTKPLIQNSLRFVIEPKQKADFVYIGDVDIIICEPVWPSHRLFFEAGLPYSNIQRRRLGRLSGLHFTRFSAYYPLAECDDLINQFRNDEELLYAIVERTGHLYDDVVIRSLAKQHRLKARPLHGIHMSTNRWPFDFFRPSWGITYEHAVTINNLLEMAEHQAFFDLLNPQSKNILLNLIFLTSGIKKMGPNYFRKQSYAATKRVYADPKNLDN